MLDIRTIDGKIVITVDVIAENIPAEKINHYAKLFDGTFESAKTEPIKTVITFTKNQK